MVYRHLPARQTRVGRRPLPPDKLKFDSFRKLCYDIINRRKTDVNNLYQSGLASANAQIEADYITNLLNQRQLAWEREQQEKQKQKWLFLQQLKIANKHKLPVVIHCRDAVEDMLQILNKNKNLLSNKF